MIRLAVSILVIRLLSGDSCRAQEQIPSKELKQEVSQILRWRAFWEGMDSFKNYVSGKQIEAEVVESAHELALFMSDVGAAISLRLTNGRISGAKIRTMVNESNASAVNKYIANNTGLAGFVLRPGASVDPSFPVRQDTVRQEQKRRDIFKQRTISIVLPKLNPPDYIVSRQAPRELSALESAVRARVSGFYNPNCGQGIILIPYFSSKDPAVYVYTDFGPNCDKGVFSFMRDTNGQWESGQFSPDRLPNDWSKTIQRIRNNLLTSIRLPEVN